jgi:hypothetical protein
MSPHKTVNEMRSALRILAVVCVSSFSFVVISSMSVFVPGTRGNTIARLSAQDPTLRADPVRGALMLHALNGIDWFSVAVATSLAGVVGGLAGLGLRLSRREWISAGLLLSAIAFLFFSAWERQAGGVAVVAAVMLAVGFSAFALRRERAETQTLEKPSHAEL